MRALLPALLVASALAGASSGCSKIDNADFCCVHDCEAHGASGPVGCANDRLVCDADSFTCIDPTHGGSCDTSDQCPAVTPYCDQTAHVCKQCLGAMGCTADAPVCSGDGACSATCTDDNACSTFSGMKHCETASGAAMGQCVQCRTGGTDCAGDTPICDQNACRACATGSECASGACDLASGACVAETNVIYLAPNATGTSCTKGQPCGTFVAALAQVSGNRTTISMAPGSYKERVTINNLSVTIIGEGADLSAVTVGQLVDISGASNVKIEGLRIHDGAGTGGDGIRCMDNGGAPTVSLHRVQLDTNTGKGINASNNCAVTLRRSRVQHNVGGGVVVMSGEFTIENNFIGVNGGLSSSLGGVSLQSPLGTGAHVFAFNTVTGNGSVSTATSGVDCINVGLPLTFSNNIVFGNTGGTGKQVNGANCAWTYSDLGDNTAGMGNITMDPMFENASQDDLHLMNGSPAKDAADPAATTNVDIDGDARPNPAGGRSDMGADEILQ